MSVEQGMGDGESGMEDTPLSPQTVPATGGSATATDAPAAFHPPSPSPQPLLEARGVVRRFGGLVAVNHVDLTIPDGAIVGLIGPNGAGKTTLFNIVAGFYAPTAGRIVFQGREIGRAHV